MVALVTFIGLEAAIKVEMISPVTTRNPMLVKVIVTVLPERAKLPEPHLRYEPFVAATVPDVLVEYVNVVSLATDVTATQVTLRLAGLATKILSEVVRPCAVAVVAVTVVPLREKLPMGIISGKPKLTMVLTPAALVR